MRYRFNAAERARYLVRRLCRTVGDAVSGFYARLHGEWMMVRTKVKYWSCDWLVVAARVYLVLVWVLAFLLFLTPENAGLTQYFAAEPAAGRQAAVPLKIYLISSETENVNISLYIITFLISQVIFNALTVMAAALIFYDFLFSYGMLLALLASGIIVAALHIKFKYAKSMWEQESEGNIHKNFATNSLFFVFIILLFGLIFAMPNVKIKDELLYTNIAPINECRDVNAYGNSDSGILKWDLPTLEGGQLDIINAEHSKAVGEIKQRIIMDNEWYHTKFILIGALFAAFFAYSSPFVVDLMKKSKQSDSGTSNNNIWTDLALHSGYMFRTILPSSVLGMACVVSLAIDMHMRANYKVTIQLGLWIENFIECLLFDNPAYIGWEAFLRKGVDDGDNIRGMHMDHLFGMTDVPHFYFLTVFLYIIYLACLFFYFVDRIPFDKVVKHKSTRLNL